mmetsp:Transcript_31665/g.57660  ORF Transcript_31665/g.57660 Transcript_31665/m.57660 type:complete len:143 (-) Transcript_31665:1117-1545(-)
MKHWHTRPKHFLVCAEYFGHFHETGSQTFQRSQTEACLTPVLPASLSESIRPPEPCITLRFGPSCETSPSYPNSGSDGSGGILVSTSWLCPFKTGVFTLFSKLSGFGFENEALEAPEISRRYEVPEPETAEICEAASESLST